MNILGDNQEIKTSVPVIDRNIVTVINNIFYDQENETVDVQYNFDEDFYHSDDVEWLNADRLRVFERSLQNKVLRAIQRIIRWEEFKNATAG